MSSQVTCVFSGRVVTPVHPCDREPNHALFVKCTTHFRSHTGRFGAPPHPRLALRTMSRSGVCQTGRQGQLRRPGLSRHLAATKRYSKDPAGQPLTVNSDRTMRRPLTVVRSDRGTHLARINRRRFHQYNYLPACFDYAAAGSRPSDLGRGADSDRSGAHWPTLPATDLPAIARCSARRGVSRRSHILAQSLEASNIRCRNAIRAQLQIRLK